MTEQVVLVTGASSGFGKVCAEHLSQRGFRVYGTSRRADYPEGQASYPVLVPMDVRDEASVRAAVEFVREREGGLDVVINNAGVGIAGAVEDTTTEEAQSLFDTNFFGMQRVCRVTLPTLRERRGMLVNVGSIAGQIPIPYQAFYSASKAAVAAYTDALRMEVKPFGVRVALVEPGDFRTGFTDNRVFAKAATDQSVFYAPCQRAVSVMAHDEQNGADPAQVAQLLERLVRDRSPRPRYLIGMFFQKFAVLLKRALPGKLSEKMLMAYYKL